MKEIKAYIKQNKLSDVTLALHKVVGLTGMSIANVQGFGHTKAKKTHEGTNNDLEDFIPCAKIEIVCHDRIVDEIVSIIEKTAYTGLRGDGKIFVSTVETAICIETGERGDKAV